jgi:uncharacterized integral membrane protein
MPSPQQAAQPSTPARKGWTVTPRQVVAAVLTALVVIVIAQNRARVEVSVLFLDVRLPLWLTLAATALIGVVIGLLVARRRARASRARRG